MMSCNLIGDDVVSDYLTNDNEMVDVKKIVDMWLEISDEYVSNYLHDFIMMYIENHQLKYSIPIEGFDEYAEVHMVSKCKLHNTIRKYTNCDELYYWGDIVEPHNPYQDSIWRLYQSVENKEDYLKKWLLFIVHQKLSTEKYSLGCYRKLFQELEYELLAEFHPRFGNAKYVLPLMRDGRHNLLEYERSIKEILYEFKDEMNYVKANNYFVVINQRFEKNVKEEIPRKRRKYIVRCD